jgi:hypothetical protein
MVMNHPLSAGDSKGCNATRQYRNALIGHLSELLGKVPKSRDIDARILVSITPFSPN